MGLYYKLKYNISWMKGKTSLFFVATTNTYRYIFIIYTILYKIINIMYISGDCISVLRQAQRHSLYYLYYIIISIELFSLYKSDLLIISLHYILHLIINI